MPSLHIVVPRDLKAWLKARARKEEVDGSMSRYIRRLLHEHRLMIQSVEHAATQAALTHSQQEGADHGDTHPETRAS